MPTVLTHPVAAVALGSVSGVRRRAIIAGAVLAVLPDADVYLARALHVADAHWLGHRGFTHSLVFAAVLATVLALALRQPRRGSAGPWPLALFLAACGASHGVLDAMTDGGPGVMLFWPFSSDRVFLPWRPIPVSPIGRGFFSEYGLHVFVSELEWIWLPCAVAISASAALRRIRARAATAHPL
jgi:inner membrane protein